MYHLQRQDFIPHLDPKYGNEEKWTTLQSGQKRDYSRLASEGQKLANQDDRRYRIADGKGKQVFAFQASEKLARLKRGHQAIRILRLTDGKWEQVYTGPRRDFNSIIAKCHELAKSSGADHRIELADPPHTVLGVAPGG